MGAGIDLRGSEQVINSFDLFETPYYQVMQGKDLKFHYLNDNIDGARELLRSNLEILEINETQAPFKIVYYSSLNTGGKLVPENMIGSNTFRVISPNAYHNLQMNNGVGSLVQNSWSSSRENKNNAEILSQQEIKIKELEDKIIELESEDKPDAVNGTNSFMGVVGMLLQDENVKQALIGRLMGLVDKILPMDNNNNKMGSLAGVDNVSVSESKIEKSVFELLEYGMLESDFLKLAVIGKTNPEYFKMLLTSLRAM